MTKRVAKYGSRMIALMIATVLAQGSALAQSTTETKRTSQQAPEAETSKNTDPSQDDGADTEETPVAIFPHSQTSRFWISGQINTILQWHPWFRAKYTGDNSLRPQAENATSRVLTLYSGVQLTKKTEIIFDLESAGGRGISDAFGLAGFTNLDVVRNPTLGSKPYLARLMIHQIIPLSSETIEATRGPLSLATKLPVRRLEIRAGKFGMADFFDLSSVGTDSHLQFLNWTVDNNGGYDYAADTRGYTFGLIVEYQDLNWGVRFAEALMPKVANGINLEWNLHRARAENLEVEFRHNFIPQRAGVVRLLTYVNHANMGSYSEAIDNFRAGRTPAPDITAHPFKTTIKYGFGINFEQEATKQLRFFGRYGWNEGRHESFAYTEVNNTVAFGFDLKGDRWRRNQDKIGAAFATNGISSNHRLYLALGGKGFLLGDGALTYGRENILETYYTLHLWRGVFTSLDLQHINNPGYNRDRGPVLVPALRLHLEF
jgi:high affinity Mn2+ porin